MSDDTNLGSMSGVVAFAHCRLVEWARWCRDQPAWPTRTVIGRLIEEGPGSHPEGMPPPTAVPTTVMVCDIAVAKLTRRQARVIQGYYLKGGSDDTCAKILRIPKHRYRYILRQARQQVAKTINELEGSVVERVDLASLPGLR